VYCFTHKGQKKLPKYHNFDQTFIHCEGSYAYPPLLMKAKFGNTYTPNFTWIQRHTHTTVSWLYGFCPGQPGWASTRRNIHPLTPIVVINCPLSASSIYYDPWHLPCSIHEPENLFPQSLSKFSVVYLLARDKNLNFGQWLTFGRLLHPAPITNEGKIWYATVDPWSMLMCHISSRVVYSVALGQQKTQILLFFWTLAFEHQCTTTNLLSKGIKHTHTHTHTHTLNSLFSRTTWVSWHQKGKPFWILLKQEMMGGSGISCTICKSFAPHSRQITTPVPIAEYFTGRMLFLMPNQQCQSTEGKGIKISSTLQRLHGEIVCTIFVVQKHDGHTHKHTNKKTQCFWSPQQWVKSESQQTWHGDRGPQTHSCASKTFGSLAYSFAAQRCWRFGENLSAT